MTTLHVPDQIYSKQEDVILFRQLGMKIDLAHVSSQDYYGWLDFAKLDIGRQIRGVEIAERDGVRDHPPLNTGVYYDTEHYDLLPTGALLRTSCGKATHAFCAYKASEDGEGIRDDYRHVFEGIEKKTIQDDPISESSVGIVQSLLNRTDVTHPGTYLQRFHGIDPRTLTPALALDSYRAPFYLWIDGKDALRCPFDRYLVYDMRIPHFEREKKLVKEVELTMYPHISEEVARDPRVLEALNYLRSQICSTFGTQETKAIKYQRAAQALNIGQD